MPTTVTQLNSVFENTADSRAAMDQLFGRHRSALRRMTPSRDEVTKFLSNLKYAISAEQNKEAGKKARRQAAIQKIQQYHLSNGSSLFAGVDPNVFAFQLALRVREPGLIDQGLYGTCGPAAMVMHLCKNDPEGYVDLALGLIASGCGTYRGMSVFTPQTVCVGFTAAKSPAVDYVVLASLAGSPVGFQDSQYGLKIEKGLSPLQFEAVLTKAGYKVDRQILSFPNLNTYGQLTPHLRQAETIIRSADGSMVFVNLNSDILLALANDKNAQILSVGNVTAATDAMNRKANQLPSGPQKVPKTMSANHHLHWILVTKMVVTATTINLKFYTWGMSMERTIPLDRFLGYYKGFIRAKF